MIKLFKKNNKTTISNKVEISKIKNAGEYPAKIILAWSKAVEGNQKILKWLSENGYEELAVACWAINLEDDARNWLMTQGYPHLMAFINAAEGNEKALRWLENHNFKIFAHMAKAIDGDIDSYHWLNKNTYPEIFILTKSIEKVKDEIEDRHRDIHKFGDW